MRVQLLAIDSPVCTDLNRANACEQWPSALAVGQRALALVEPDGLQPADAVVPYSKVSFSDANPHSVRQSHADVTPDVDWPSVDSTIQQEPEDGGAPTASSSTCNAPVTKASAVGLLPSRCLQDARTLLRNLIAPDNIAADNSAPHNNNKQEDSP